MAKKPTYEELLAENQRLQGSKEITFRVGDKGGVSVYGLGRFPTTLYYEQWLALIAATDKLSEFLEANKSKLKLKAA